MRWRRLRLDTVSTFFQTVQIKAQVSHQILKIGAFPLASGDLLASDISCGVAAQTLLACLHELFGPRVEVIGFDAFTSTQFVDCDLATKAL